MDDEDLTPVENLALLRERITSLLSGLGLGELAVIEQIVARIRIGRERYGELRVETDRRDFQREAAEEALDCAVYLSTMLLRHTGRS